MSPQESTEALLAYMTETNNKSSEENMSWDPTDFKPYDHDPHYSQARILDALANICISDPDSESIAVAMKRTSHHGLEIVIATDQDMPLKTIKHIEGVWVQLQLLSELNSEIVYTKPTSNLKIDYVQEQVLRARKCTVEASIWRECLKFSWKIFQKRLNSRFNDFKGFYDNNRQDSPGKRLFQEVYQSITVIEFLYTRVVEPGEEGEECRRELSTDTEWEIFHDCLQRLNYVVDRLLKTLPFKHAHKDQNQKPNFNVASWLWKVISLYKDIRVLVKLGHGNRKHRRNMWLLKKFTVTFLPRNMSVRPALPDSQEQWLNVVRSAFEDWNRMKKKSDGNMEMVQDRVSADCGKMTKLTSSHLPTAAHGVCAIVSHFLQEEKAGLSRPHFYIGTSTPLCHGCSEFIYGVNAVFGTKWAAKVELSLEKSAFWRFPNTSLRGRVVEIMYDKICALFVCSYDGFEAAAAACQDDDDSSDSD
ncbi:hypothetical protein MMC14_001364 [Varicellaria rhodocarpa]|nr:hypothetical protein [Varicellaria rhodocarpa]